MDQSHVKHFTMVDLQTIPKIFIILFISLIFAASAFSQQKKLVLQSKQDRNKKMEMNLKRPYIIQTTDSTYFEHLIISYSDSSLILENQNYDFDTLPTEVKFSEITSIKKYWLKRRRVLAPFAFGVFTPILAIPLAGMVWANGGGQTALDGLIFAGTVSAVCAPFVFVGTRKTKYDLRHDWVLQTN
jgi:hypothetical protein